MTKLCEFSNALDFDKVAQHFTPIKVSKDDACFGALFRCECGKICVNDINNSKNSTVQKHVTKKHSAWIPKVTSDKTNGTCKRPNEYSADEEQSKVKKKQKIDIESLNSQRVTKREDYLSWDDYFMSVAFLSAMRSKDPSTQVGACIVNPEKKIVGIGYNGFPQGCNDDELPWARRSESGSQLDTKYPYVCHAEMNAILNKNSAQVKGCSIYVALFPCNECAKLIIQSGIKTVVYYSDKYHDDWNFVASRRLMDMAGVKYIQHKMDMSDLTINFTSVL